LLTSKSRRERLQFILQTVVIVLLLLGPIAIGSMLPVPDFVRDSPLGRQPSQLIHPTEDLRKLQDTWKRIWFEDQPDHMTPERVHGGVI